MKVIKRDVMPDGTGIQIEDWSMNYDFMKPMATIAAYPVAKESGYGYFAPVRGEKFRFEIDCESAFDAEKLFNQLKKGEINLLNLDKANNIRFFEEKYLKLL